MTFFSNHSMVRSGVLISIVSLLLGFGNFYYSISIQREQNRRWDALNINGVELIDTGFIIYKQISEQERTQTDWGYNPIALRFTKDRIISDKYQLPYELLLVKLPIVNANFERVPNSNYFFTVAEANEEIKRLGLQQGTFKIYKHLQIQFDFKNLGKTIAKDVRIRITGKDPQTGIEVTPFNQDETIDLLPDRGGSTTVPLWCPINEDLPKILKFTASITYRDVHGKAQERSVPVIYDSTQNYWMYGH
jgi:hypothetical protein